MANNCYYEMKIKGSRKNCYEWVKKMKSCTERNHFYRIFESDVYDEDGTEAEYYMQICGDCAWSLESCCRASGYPNGRDLFAINTKDLEITMEVYSKEPGIGFQEHYIYRNGECLADECVDYIELYWDKNEFKTFEQFKSECNISDDIKEADFTEEGWFDQGGFRDWDFLI